MGSDPNLYLKKIIENPRLAVWWLIHRATAALRAQPDFLIAGVQKGGTSSLYAYLAQHPSVLPSFRKEIKFFDSNYFCGLRWYQAHFPLRSKVARENRITGEGTPNYLFHPTALQRAALAYPRAKIILLLRNPIDRAYSHYHHQVRVGHEKLSFEEAAAKEPERLAGEAAKVAADYRYPQTKYINFSYLSSGRYIEQVPKVFDLFPRENILIHKSEDFYQRTGEVYLSTLAFLGLPLWVPPAYQVFKEGKYAAMAPQTRAELGRYFKPYNQALYEYLGRDFGWENEA